MLPIFHGLWAGAQSAKGIALFEKILGDGGQLTALRQAQGKQAEKSQMTREITKNYFLSIK